jgi:5-methylcytosine-specific restriction protein A
MAVWPYTTQRWQRLRKQKLQRDPLCEACLQHGKIEPAIAVDHRKPIKAGGEPFPHLDQLAALCEGCHNTKTRAEQLGREPAPKVVKGCDARGNPLDPNHDWYRI